MKKTGFLSLLLLHSFANSPAFAGGNCAGADPPKLTSTIYVSPQGADSANCGQNTGTPCKTIQQGITNCPGEGCGVLVRYGVYSLAKPVDLKEGVSLYGSCIFDETTFRYRSTLIGSPAIRANGINKPTTVYGFVILGSSAVSAGAASFAVVVSSSNGLKLSHDLVSSGKGGAGGNSSTSNGSIGGYGRPASGNDGGAGGRACSINPPTGSVGEGGRGADFQQLYSYGCFFTCKCENNNYPASLGKNGMSSGAVPGGEGGQRGSAGCVCSIDIGNAGNGPGGAGGKPGTCGNLGGASNLDVKGSFAGTVWAPNRGGTGAAAQVGSGGGGGGSGGFGVGLGPVYDYPGYPGGGGGGGGCGGPGGTGGQQGGASIPLVLFASSMVGLADVNVFIPGPGGKGGSGANGGTGGNGGTGAAGKTGPQDDIKKTACIGTVPGFGGRGGDGGQGGAGSGGAGGNGGPSFGIALVSSPAFPATGIYIYPAQAGEGGQPGLGGQNSSAQCKGAGGQAGRSGFFDNQNSIVIFNPANQPIGSNQ